jgi:hypothetical protein
MDEKISLKLVEEYAVQFTKQVSNSFFAGKQNISGREILSITPIKQVNLFVVRDLLKLWKKESEKLKSPYFDYTAPEVKEALAQFQNTLSNHIFISKNDFSPLLIRAVTQTLYLILDPYDFYSDTLDSEVNQNIRTSDLKDEIKYIKTNRAPLEKLVAKLEESGRHQISGNEAFAMLDQILEAVNFTPEEVEHYLNAFNQVLPVKLEDFYEVKVTPPAPAGIPASIPLRSEPVASYAAANTPKESSHTLADDLAKKKIVRLKENLSINQKFMFTKILFHGDFEIFSDAIDKLDRMDNLSQAVKFLEDSYPHWDKESEEYLEFLEIVERRFS